MAKLKKIWNEIHFKRSLNNQADLGLSGRNKPYTLSKTVGDQNRFAKNVPNVYRLINRLSLRSA